MISFITGNAHKLAEVQAILPDVIQADIDLPEIQEIDPHEIIRAKLEATRGMVSGGYFVEDTSLYLEGLNGLPGPLIKWFLKALTREGVVKLARDSGTMRATAKTMIGYADEKGAISFFEGTVSGTIVDPRVDSAFGWDPIFQPDGYNKTFAEMTSDEKNAISMRRRAVEKLKDALIKSGL